jgi:hypothetical protein
MVAQSVPGHGERKPERGIPELRQRLSNTNLAGVISAFQGANDRYLGEILDIQAPTYFNEINSLIFRSLD